MFDIFDNLLFGQEVEFNGKQYIQLKQLNAELIMAVAVGAKMPAIVVVIPAKKIEKQEKDQGQKNE